MMWKFKFALCFLAITSRMGIAQNSTGNILTGDAKADVVKHYSGPAALPKPEKILICDFTVPVADITTDKSIAGQLHRRLMLRHGVDEDSSAVVLAQQVQAAFSKTLAGELKKTNIQTLNIPAQKTSSAAGAMNGSTLVIAGEFVAIHEGDETKRIMIGFGRGASDIKTHVTVSSVTRSHSTVRLGIQLVVGKWEEAWCCCNYGGRFARCWGGSWRRRRQEVNCRGGRFAHGEIGSETARSIYG